MFGRVMEASVLDRRVVANPVSGVRLPKAHQREHRYLTAEQLDALAVAAGDDGLLVQVLGWCGLR